MDLSPDAVDRLAAEYDAVQPLAAIEDEHLEVLPPALASGSYGWRDAEWIVRWYGRRFLGRYPDAERRAIEDAFRENAFDDVRAALADAIDAESESTTATLEPLTDLTGVDVPVATAFAQFTDPARYLVMSDHEWRVLRASGELVRPYPSQPSPADYERYLRTCRAVADRCDCDLRTVYRALWVADLESTG